MCSFTNILAITLYVSMNVICVNLVLFLIAAPYPIGIIITASDSSGVWKASQTFSRSRLIVTQV